MDSPAVTFACPRCRSPLIQTATDELGCPADGLRFERRDGIWRMLLPEREQVFSQFIREYEAVRRAEGRGSEDPAYYRSLPFRDLSGRMAADWRIRAASFSAFLKHIVVPLEGSKARSLVVLDLGAGNGWLSNCLARRGHTAVAVDLMTNDFDGLGCHRCYDTTFTPVQAEFDRLPLPDSAVDLVVFNASLHYSIDYLDTLREACRVLGAGGDLVILDSPIYQDPSSGEQMVREREARFTSQVGFASNALLSENYLTYQRLEQLGSALGLRCRMITPFYGLRWLLRPVKAHLLGRREPAKFHLIVYKKG